MTPTLTSSAFRFRHSEHSPTEATVSISGGDTDIPTLPRKLSGRLMCAAARGVMAQDKDKVRGMRYCSLDWFALSFQSRLALHRKVSLGTGHGPAFRMSMSLSDKGGNAIVARTCHTLSLRQGGLVALRSVCSNKCHVAT